MYHPARQIFASGSIAVLALAAASGIGSAAPKDPSGTYVTEDGRGRIRVEKCGPSLANVCGYLVWSKNPLTDGGQQRVDRRNPDPAKTSRQILGHQLMLGLALNKEENYQGLIYNNEDGKNYDITIYPGDGVLKVKGCLVALLCRTDSWKRVDDVLPGQLTGATGTPTGPQPDPEWRSVAGEQPGAPAKGKAPVKAKQTP